MLRLLLAGTFLASCAPPSAEVQVASQAVIGGAADSGDPAVVSLVTVPDAGAPELCTATVIAPRALLTAGHCAIDQNAGTLTVGVGPSAKSPQRTLAVASVHAYPSFHGSDDLPAGVDIGVVLLAEDSGITPVPLLGGLPTAGSARLVGFGMTDGQNLDSRGNKDSATVVLTPVCATLVQLGDLSSNACHGDSGGPLLVGDGSGAELLGAVVSFGADSCAPPSYAVPVAPYASWISGVLAGQGDACVGGCPVARSCLSDGGVADGPSPDGGTAASANGCAMAPSSSGSPSLSLLLLAALLLRGRRGARAKRPDRDASRRWRIRVEPAVRKHHGLTLAPILVEDFGSILGHETTIGGNSRTRSRSISWEHGR